MTHLGDQRCKPPLDCPLHSSKLELGRRGHADAPNRSHRFTSQIDDRRASIHSGQSTGIKR
jgi:hypothetical protein